MKQKHPSRLLAACITALLVCLCPYRPLPAASPPQTLTGLILGSDWFQLDSEVRKRFDAEGVRFVVRKLSDPLNAEMLRLFDFVLLPDFEGLSISAFVPTEYVIKYSTAKQNIALLHQYVESGGGVFVSPMMREAGPAVVENSAPLLAPWGAKLVAAQVRDDLHDAEEKKETKKNPTLPYSWTTAITKSPVSEGVKRLWYPTNMLRWDAAYATVPFVLNSREWRPVVRGMRESVAAHGLQYTTWIPLPDQKAPVIAAVRVAGKGRVALLGVSAFYTFTVPFAKSLSYGESNTGITDGIFLEKGDGKAASNGQRLLLNMFRWLAEANRAAGFGGYSEEAMAKLPKPSAARLPAWLSGWRADTGAQPVKVLIGARSAFSDGKGTVAEYADAAKKAGYSILVMTETFERLSEKSWDALVAACDAATTNEFVVMPGIDIADVYQNRYLVFGQRVYPSPFMLSEDGKAMKQCQYFSLGFGTHFTAIHRASTSPLPHPLEKFFSGIVVYTYRNGKRVDDSLLPYQWQVENESVPLPLVAHETYAPADVAKEAATGHQLFIMADTVANAAWYLRPGMAHFWESPALFLVTEGPMVRALEWGRIVADGGPLRSPSPDVPGQIVIESKAPITEVVLQSQYDAVRRWRPMTNSVSLSFHLPPSHHRWAFVIIKDEKGRTAITPAINGGPAARYSWRCSDRQNFFGFAERYTGTRLSDIDIGVPVSVSDEGRGFWPHPNGPLRGVNLAPLLEFPWSSPAVTITDAFVDQRYWKALWEEVAYDARSSQGTSRANVYDAHVRYYDFNLNEDWREHNDRRPMMIKEVSIRLRMPVPTTGRVVFPSFTSVGPKPKYGYVDPQTGKEVAGTLTEGFVDLPVGGFANDLIALTPLRVTATGGVGFAAPAWSNGPLPIGTSWSGRYVRVPDGKQVQEMRSAMGFSGKPAYELKLARGKLDSLAYVAHLTAGDFAVAGTIQPAVKMPYHLPLFITGVNAHWDSAVWREDDSLTRFGVFEGGGIARLDVTKGGRFFAGNLITAQNRELRLTILRWNDKGIAFEAHNPTDVQMETTVETATEISARYHLKQTIQVPKGSSVTFSFP